MIDLIGRKFTRLLVTDDLGFKQVSDKIRKRWFKCLCDCGIQVETAYGNLISNNTKSCGCLQKEILILRNSKHGATVGGNWTRTYTSWKNMKARCTNPKAESYKNYGGRGITYCERWRDFNNFIVDMGECPVGLTIERINNNGDYEPNNCKWATTYEQSINKRLKRYVTINGELMGIYHASRMTGIPYQTIAYWYANNIAEEKISQRFSRC